MIDEGTRLRINKAESWSVEYRGAAYDDARQVDGRWHYRDLLTREYREFPSQHDVVPLSQNPPHTELAHYPSLESSKNTGRIE
jgi:hypothetical protein